MRLITTACLALISLSTIGCGAGSEAEQGLKDLISLMDGMTAAIERNDEAGLQKVAQDMKSLGERMKSIKPSKSEEEALKSKYEPEIKKATERMTNAMKKNPQILGKMKDFGELMKKF